VGTRGKLRAEKPERKFQKKKWDRCRTSEISPEMSEIWGRTEEKERNYSQRERTNLVGEDQSLHITTNCGVWEEVDG